MKFKALFVLLLFFLYLFSLAYSLSDKDEKALKNCLCRCGCRAEGWLCGEVVCSYSPGDYCSQASEGPCLCEGFGCGRAEMATSGECYESCINSYAPNLVEDCSNGKDDDFDKKIDCRDSDCIYTKYCKELFSKEAAKSLKKRYAELLDRYNLEYKKYKLDNIYNDYRDNPALMIKKMREFMMQEVYGVAKIKKLLNLMKGSDEDYNNMLKIIHEYKDDPVMMHIRLERYVYSHSTTAAQKESLKEMVLTGVLDPPTWLSPANSNEVLDWASLVTENLEKTPNGFKIKGKKSIKIFNKANKIFVFAQDAKSLLEHSKELKSMNLDDSTKVSIIVLDGATKIGKMLDPTGYFGNMADASIDALIKLRKKIESRSQGCTTWQGHVICDPDNTGIYEDFETGKRYRHVSGGWFSRSVYVEVE